MKHKTVRLEKEECLALRPLWEEVFSEDSKEYTDFYFENKAGRNTAFALYAEEAEENKAVAMVHLSPYEMELRTGDTFWHTCIYYIVGVATAGKYRHRGFMDRLLKASLKDMYSSGRPFTFLMPANPKIYEPYQFVYIYDRKNYRLREEATAGKELKAASFLRQPLRITVMADPQLQETAAVITRYLEENFDVFIRRDEAYFDLLIKELKAQSGAMYLIKGEEETKGYFLCTREEGKTEIQEALALEENAGVFENGGILEETTAEPAIMARIVHVQNMFSLLRLKQASMEKEEMVFTFFVTDTLLPENNGLWQCRIGKKQAEAVRLKEAENPPVEYMADIDALTSWIFGYKKPEECFCFGEGTVKEEALGKINKVRILSHVWINEIT